MQSDIVKQLHLYVIPWVGVDDKRLAIDISLLEIPFGIGTYLVLSYPLLAPILSRGPAKM